MSETNVSNARKLTEAAVMIAVGTVLSLIKLLDMPYGGSVTIACMLPVILIAYRHGVKFGLLTGFTFGLIQQLLGFDNLSYVSTWQSVLAVVLLDYVVAYMAVGFGGSFRKLASQPVALMSGAILACVLRYLCHVISGATVWAGLSIPTGAALIYSVGYNATYMIPETIVTAILAYYVGSILDFRGTSITHLKKTEKSRVPFLKWIGGLVLAAALVFDVRTVFENVQNADTGEFDATGFTTISWTPILIVTAAAVAVAVVLFVASSGKKEKKLPEAETAASETNE